MYTPIKSIILPRLSVSSPKLLDVFSSKTNLNLVLEFLDTDLEMIIKDRSLVFLPADIKSWMAMTFRGLEFCHRNFILHRVRTPLHHVAFRYVLLTQFAASSLFARISSRTTYSSLLTVSSRLPTLVWLGTLRTPDTK